MVRVELQRWCQHLEGLRDAPPPPSILSLALLHDLRHAASLIPLRFKPFKATLGFCRSGIFPPSLLSRLL